MKTPAGEPVTLFTAKEAPWAKPVPFAMEAFGLDEMYFSDGPSLLKLEDGLLYMIFSSWSVNGYAVGVALSEFGCVNGPWALQTEPLYPQSRGPGMFFRDTEGRLLLTLHHPNDPLQEHPHFWKIHFENRKLALSDRI